MIPGQISMLPENSLKSILTGVKDTFSKDGLAVQAIPLFPDDPKGRF